MRVTTMWLGQSVASQDLSLVLALNFWNPFSMEGYLGQLRYRIKGLVPTSK